MQSGNRAILARAAGAVGVSALALALALTFGAAQAQDKTYVMKVTLPTINDAPHQFAKDFAALVEKDFRGGAPRRAHQGRGLSGEPARLDPAADRRHAIRRHPGRDRTTGILRRRRRALRGHGDAGARRIDRAWPAHRRRSAGAQA